MRLQSSRRGKYARQGKLHGGRRGRRETVSGKGKQRLWQTKQNSLNNWCASSLYILLFCWLRYSIYVMCWLQTGNPLSFTDIGNQNLQNFWCCIWLENPCTSEQTATWFLPFATFLEVIQRKGRVHRIFFVSAQTSDLFANFWNCSLWGERWCINIKLQLMNLFTFQSLEKTDG